MIDNQKFIIIHLIRYRFNVLAQNHNIKQFRYTHSDYFIEQSYSSPLSIIIPILPKSPLSTELILTELENNWKSTLSPVQRSTNLSNFSSIQSLKRYTSRNNNILQLLADWIYCSKQTATSLFVQFTGRSVTKQIF